MTRNSKNILVRFSPWSYILLVIVGFVVMLFASNNDTSRSSVPWLLAYVLFWIVSTVVVVFSLAFVGFRDGDLHDRPAQFAFLMQRSWPIWGITYALLFFDVIFATHTAASLIGFVILNAAYWYNLRRKENVKMAEARLRRAEANTYSAARVEAPRVQGDPYAGIGQEPEPVPVAPLRPGKTQTIKVEAERQDADPYAGIGDDK